MSPTSKIPPVDAWAEEGASGLTPKHSGHCKPHHFSALSQRVTHPKTGERSSAARFAAHREDPAERKHGAMNSTGIGIPQSGRIVRFETPGVTITEGGQHGPQCRAPDPVQH